MRLYSEANVRSRRLEIFLIEKQVEIQTDSDGLVVKDREPFAALQHAPMLVLSDSSVITETIAICRYFEGVVPEPNLFGRDAIEVAKIDVWNRRLELEFYLPLRALVSKLPQDVQAKELLKTPPWWPASRGINDLLDLIDSELAKRQFIVGDRFTIADITAFASVELAKCCDFAILGALQHLNRWHSKVCERPSTSAKALNGGIARIN